MFNMNPINSFIMKGKLVSLSLALVFVTGLVSCNIFSGSGKIVVDEKESDELFTTSMDSVSYLIGAEIGTSFKTNEIHVRLDAFMKGVEDAINDVDTLFTDQQKNEIMTAFQFRLQMAEMERREKLAAENRQEEEDFLRKNRQDPDVIETESGIQYRVISMGTGEKPKETDTVRVHYEGRFIDGEVFDASRRHGDNPVEFPLNRVIQGWTEGVQLMPVGSTFEFYIPSHLGYGERGNDRIPPAKMLVFTVELIEIVRK